MINNAHVKKNAGVLIVFILLGLGIYLNSLQNGFHYDDRHHIVQNPYIQNPGNIPLFFTEHRTFSTLSGVFLHYRPLILVSYALNFYFGRLNPVGYHLVNLGLHIGSAFILFLIISNMMKEMEGRFFTGFAAGLLFLTTPFNTEVVNYITARSSVMSTFFCLLAFYFWVRFRSQKEEDRSQSPSSALSLTSIFYLASLLAFLLGMLTKEVAIMLPPLILLYDIYFRKILTKLSLRTFLPYIPFGVIGILLGFVIRITVLKGFKLSSVLPGGSKEQESEFLNNLIIGVRVLAKYSYSVIAPFQLSVWHQIDGSPGISFLLSFILVIGLLVLAYILWRSADTSGKIISFFILWFFVTLLPMTIVSLTAPYQENRGHIAAVGIIVAVVIGLIRLKDRLGFSKSAAAISYAILGIVIVLYSAGTVMSNTVWKDDLSLWTHVSEMYPDSIDARVAINLAYMRSGDLDTAEAGFETILKSDPQNSGALTNLGIINYRRRDLDSALSYFLKSKGGDSFDPTTNAYLAKIYKEKGDLPSTARQLLLLIAISPHNITAYQELAEVYAKMGELGKIYNMMVRAIEEDPDNPGAHRALGLIHMYGGRLGEAQLAFEKALSAAPYNQDIILDLGYTYARQGMFDQAGEMFKRVIYLSPYDTEASQALANVYQRQGKLDEALALYKSILDKNPEQFNSYTNLGLVYFSRKEPVLAVEAFGKALSLNPDDYAARFNLARVYEIQGKKELARKELQGVMSRTAGNSQTREIYEVAQRKIADLR